MDMDMLNLSVDLCEALYRIDWYIEHCTTHTEFNRLMVERSFLLGESLITEDTPMEEFN